MYGLKLLCWADSAGCPAPCGPAPSERGALRVLALSFARVKQRDFSSMLKRVNAIMVDAALVEYGMVGLCENVRRWCDGFVLDGVPSIYNPWPITKFLEGGGFFDAYWANTSSNVLVSEVVRRGGARLTADFEALLAGSEVRKVIDEQVEFYVRTALACHLCVRDGPHACRPATIAKSAISECETSQEYGDLGSFLVSKNTGPHFRPHLPADLRGKFSADGKTALKNYPKRGILG